MVFNTHSSSAENLIALKTYSKHHNHIDKMSRKAREIYQYNYITTAFTALKSA